MSGTNRRHTSGGGEIVTIQCGSSANWLGTQYHLLQNSNCDINSQFARATHFRRSESNQAGGSASKGSNIVGENDATSSIWHPRVVCMDASIGLDGILATFANQPETVQEEQEQAIEEYQQKTKRAKQEEKEESTSSSSSTSSKRPQHWNDLAKNIMPFHRKSLYSVPGLYEGTTDFHLHEQGKEIMEREAIHEEVIDRTRWFLEECDQPDGLHVIVEANSGWSGVGSTLLGLLRDEYEKIPIFCISSLTPPAPPSIRGRSFTSSTTTVQSVLNASLLLQSASQLATAYLPLTTHYWLTNPMAQQALPQAHRAIQNGEIYESATMMAWLLHLATAEYRIQPRSTNMATMLAGLTQQCSANVLGVKLTTQLQLEQQSLDAAANFNQSNSSSNVALTPVIHTQPTAFPFSLLGHGHAFPPVINSDEDEHESSSSSSSSSSSKPVCGANTSLTESVHVFGRTEEMSHLQLIETMEKQPTALFRRVYGTSRMNLPPSFPMAYYDLLNDGHVLSTYRCSGLGDELSQWGSWLTQLNRGAITASHYTVTSASSTRNYAQLPIILQHLQTQRRRNDMSDMDEDGERVRGAVSQQLQMPQWSQDELDEFIECGTTLQNLSELY